MAVLDIYTHPSWLDDDEPDPEPEPDPAETLTVTRGVVWWTLAEDDDLI